MVPVEKSFDDRMFFYQFCKFNLSQSFNKGGETMRVKVQSV